MNGAVRAAQAMAGAWKGDRRRWPLPFLRVFIGFALIGFLPGTLFAEKVPPRRFASDSGQQYAFAQSLFAAGRFVRAAVEFERFVFLFADNPREFDARFKAADAYYRAGQYREAMVVLRDAIARAASPQAGHRETNSDMDRFYFLLSRCQKKNNYTGQALITLHNLLATSRNPAVRDDARYLGAWILIEQARWPEARRWLSEISPGHRDRYMTDQLTAELSASRTISRKNPRLAGLLSLLPGTGQLYVGRYQDALVAFLLNTATIWAAVEAFDKDQPVLGGLLSVVGINFYTGNIYSAVNSAHKYNRRKTEAFIENLKRHTRIHLSGNTGEINAGVQVGIDF